MKATRAPWRTDRRTRGRRARPWWVLLGWLAIAMGCGAPPSAGRIASPTVPRATAAAPPAATPCAQARELRQRAASLISEGKLDRAVRIIERADVACPTERHRSWAQLVATLAELGDATRVRTLAAEIEAAPQADGAMKRAAGLAREQVAQESDGPNGRAMLDAGLLARKQGRGADAQRLLDRARWALERDAGTAARIDASNGLPGGAGAAAWTADGRRFALAHRASVRVFDASTLQEQLRLEGHHHRVTSIAFSPDGKRIASGSEKGGVRLWELGNGHPLRRLAAGQVTINRLAFTADGARLVTASHAVRLWDLTSGANLWALAGMDFSLSRDGALLAVMVGDGDVRIWDMATRQPLRRIMPAYALGVLPPSSSVSRAWFCSDGARLATTYLSAGAWVAIRLWDGPSGRPLGPGCPIGLMRWTVSLAPDCSRLASAGPENHIHVYDTGTGQERIELPGHEDGEIVGAFAPSGDRLLSAAADGTARIWEAASGRERARIEGHAARPRAMVFTATDSRLVTVMSDRTVRVWDFAAGALRTRAGPVDESAAGKPMVLSPDAELLAWADGDRRVKIWDVAAQREIARLGDGKAEPRHIALSSSPARIAVSFSDQSLRLYEARSGAERWRQPVPWHRSLAFSPDAKTLAVAYRGLRLLRVADGSALAELDENLAPIQVAFSSDGDQLALLRKGSLRPRLQLCSLRPKLSCDRSLELPYSITPPTSLAFSPGGAKVAVGLGAPDDESRSVVVMDTATGRQASAHGGHPIGVAAVAYSSDGTLLASASTDGDVVVRALGRDDSAVSLRAVRGAPAGYLRSQGGLIELVGDKPEASRPHLSCRIGGRTYPFALCEERFTTAGLLTQLTHAEGTGAPPGAEQ